MQVSGFFQKTNIVDCRYSHISVFENVRDKRKHSDENSKFTIVFKKRFINYIYYSSEKF